MIFELCHARSTVQAFNVQETQLIVSPSPLRQIETQRLAPTHPSPQNSVLPQTTAFAEVVEGAGSCGGL